MIVLVLAAALAGDAAGDERLRAALDLVYQGATETAVNRLASLAAAAPEDPVARYLEALALCWKIEERPGSQELDARLHETVDEALAVADARLEEDPDDLRARLARGAAHGVRSRLFLFRRRGLAAGRAAARMRSDLQRALALEPSSQDALFGLGLYDFYADVLPRGLKLMRLLVGIPGGDRDRGLRRMELAKGGTLFHDTEVLVQLVEIYAEYEHQPDRALRELRQLRSRSPGSPLWGLKLAALLRDMGVYDASAAVARELIVTSEAGHPNDTAVVAAMARLSFGESLLLDLRFEEAATALRPLCDGEPETRFLRPKAHLLLGRSVELRGNRQAAEPHYRVAKAASEPRVSGQAGDALETPIPDERVRAMRDLCRGRQLRRAGLWGEAALAYRGALAAWPRSQEAALGVAENLVRHGRLDWAREVVNRLASAEQTNPPWVRAWSQLVRGRILDQTGDRGAAVLQYQEVWERPWGRDDLQQMAGEGLRAPYAPH
jgi:tetratricopeptide (TPR) repeat protein